MKTYQQVMQTIDDWDDMTKPEKLLVKYTELSMFAPKVQELLDKRIDPEIICACIYDLYMDFHIYEETENELYKIADPYGFIDSPAEFWREYTGNNLLLEDPVKSLC